MSSIEICVLILTMVSVLVAVYLVSFLISCRATLKRAQSLLDNAEETLRIVNDSLPEIADETTQIISHVNGLTGKIDRGVGLGMTVLEKTPLSAIYTIVGLGRSISKKFSSKKQLSSKRKSKKA
ncbi:MAG: DUF948 domain-containing protein [Peptococcaceae bacterium]|jgi:uncharacterized protein YoxC|nr:DUF948 domain-containing protein [Peptococcaceae bacterium]